MERIVYRKTLDVHKNGTQFTLQGFETSDNMSREIEISLMASGDTIDFPLEQIMAMMYVFTPNATEPSINKCTIKDNKIVYKVLPIEEEGITEMQLKLIETRVDGATRVLISPKFAIEVSKSNVDDESAEQTTTFTALEDAAAKAKSVYDARFVRMEIDELCIFRAYYADGTVYETDTIRRCLLEQSTELDLKALVKDGIANFTAEEVAEVLDEKYSNLLSKAKYVEDLNANFDVPMFVKWDAETINTPYKAELTTITDGYALVYGNTISAWANGEAFTYGANGWDKAITSSGGTMEGPLTLGGGKGSVSADEEGSFVESAKDTTNYRQIKIINPVNDSVELKDAIKVVETIEGNETTYNIFGEHNFDKISEKRYVRFQVKNYEGNGKSGKENPNSMTFDFEPKVVIFGGPPPTVALNGQRSITYYRTSSCALNLNWDGKTISWYANSKVDQFNSFNSEENKPVSYFIAALG